MNVYFDLLLLSVMISIVSSLVGTFLILRGGSLTAFALSHSILLGIVITFLFTRDLNSPFLPVGAALTGVIIVSLVEFLTKSRFIKQDAALGIIYLFVFSLGLIMIAKYAANTTLSAKAAITGNIALIPFDRFIIAGYDLGPKLLWITILVLLINIIYIGIFYKELKITAIDSEYAHILGFNPTFINLSFMFIVSITIVTTFSVAGVVIAVGLMVIPPATAFMLTKELRKMIALSIVIAIISGLLGFFIAWNLGSVEISSVITIVAGLIFMIVTIFTRSGKN